MVSQLHALLGDHWLYTFSLPETSNSIPVPSKMMLRVKYSANKIEFLPCKLTPFLIPREQSRIESSSKSLESHIPVKQVLESYHWEQSVWWLFHCKKGSKTK